MHTPYKPLLLSAFALALTTLTGCPSQPVKPDSVNITPPKDTTPPTPPAWNCSGNLTPPTGWEQETSFEDASNPNAEQRATDNARMKLLRRLCGDSDCTFLTARSSVWKTGRDDNRVCSMVVVDSKDLDTWRDIQLSLGRLDGELQGALKQLLGLNEKTKNTPFIAIDRIMDAGAPGGPRARWLQKRFEAAASSLNVDMVDIPKGWAGDGMPRGVDVLIRAVATPRREQQRDVVEVVWESRTVKRGRVVKRASKPILFPVDAAPSPGDSFTSIPGAGSGISIRLDADKGGSLCLGEKTQVWLRAKTSMHVRVFDLYGKDGALLLFPNPSNPSGKVPAGKTIPIGPPEGFAAIPAQGTHSERFLVLASPDPKDLGPFASLQGYCKLPARTAMTLHKGDNIPKGTIVASDGFRIIEEGFCPAPPPKEELQSIDDNLARIPTCNVP